MLRRAKPLLGTLVEVACGVGTECQASRLQSHLLDASQAAFTSVARVHALMSAHEPQSDLSRFNDAPPGQWVVVDAETLAVFEFALQLSRATQGVFDVCTIGPAAARGFWCDIEIDASRLRLLKHAPLRADLGGIAKGYAVDAAVKTLQLAGANQGWVNAGGDLRVFGNVSVPLRVRAPWDLSETLSCSVVQNRAAATSAGYWRSTELASPSGPPPADARCLRHGVTAQPVTLGQSWTVLAATCMAADALTKVVAATGNTHHPVLAHCGAQAWIF